jgi:hypothetical protein
MSATVGATLNRRIRQRPTVGAEPKLRAFREGSKFMLKMISLKIEAMVNVTTKMTRVNMTTEATGSQSFGPRILKPNSEQVCAQAGHPSWEYPATRPEGGYLITNGIMMNDVYTKTRSPI